MQVSFHQRKQNITCKPAKQLKKQLEQDVAELMLDAKKANNATEEEGRRPKKISSRKKLSQKMDEAMISLKDGAYG